jgi:hypothetical protein
MTLYLDKARIFALQATLGECYMKLDDEELRRDIRKHTSFIEYIGSLEKGTLLELV